MKYLLQTFLILWYSSIGFAQNSILIDWLKTLPEIEVCLLYTSPSPRDRTRSRMPSSA